MAHVSYAGRPDDSGKFVTRYGITLASQLDEETCGRVNLGFADLKTFRISDYEDDPNTLIVERAGRDLYLVEPDDD